MRTGYLQLSSAAAVLTLGLLLNGAARAGDLLEEAKAKQAIAAQAMERLVDDARRDAYRLAKSRPSDAAELLRSTLKSLEADTALKADKRESLIRSVRNDLKQFESDIRDVKSGIPSDSSRLARAEEERRRVEAEAIRRTQSDISRMQSAGRTDEAKRLYDDLARRFPGNPSVQAGSKVGGRADAIAQQADIRRQVSEGRLMVWVNENKSMIIPAGDMEFPRDWVEKSNRRTKANRVTEKEKAIIKALNTVIPVEFGPATFQEVMDFLEKKTGVSLIIDKQALTEANVTYDTPITFKAKTTMRTVLKRILGDLNLGYVVKDEAIQVTSLQKARETLSTRTYYVGDLAAIGDMRFGGGIGRGQMAAQIQQLAVLITQTVDPDSWMINDKGGLGTIAFDPISMSFVVRQTAEIHYQMGFGFR